MASPAAQTFKGYVEELDKKQWHLLAGSKHAEPHQMKQEVAELQSVIESFREVAIAVASDVLVLDGTALVPIGEAQGAIGQAVSALEQHAGWSVQQAEQQHPAIRQKVREHARQAMRTLVPFLALARNADLASKLSTLADLGAVKKEFETRSQELTSFRETGAETLAKMQAAIEDSRKVLASIPVAKQGKSFSDATADFKKSANTWAIVAVAVAGLLLTLLGVVIVCMFEPPRPSEGWTVAANLGYFAARALVVSVLSFLLVVAVRNYRSAKHNEIMNAHRWRALQTFGEFRSASEGSPVHDAILLHATEAIFSVQASGFAPGEPLGATHVGELLKLVKSDGGAGQ
jgi:hypothetical protein